MNDIDVKVFFGMGAGVFLLSKVLIGGGRDDDGKDE